MYKGKVNIGDKVKDLIIINKHTDKWRYVCECQKCKHCVYLTPAEILKYNINGCKKCNEIDIKLGDAFKDVVVIEIKHKGHILVKCNICNRIHLSTKKLLCTRNINGCRDCNKESSITNSRVGKSYNDLTIISYNLHDGYKCLCHQCNRIINYKSWSTLLERKNGCKLCNRHFHRFHDILKTHGYLRRIEYSARQRKLEFNITWDYIENLLRQQNYKCVLTGLEIYLNYPKNDSTASLDRIDNTIGYVEGNVQWIHKAINKMKLNHTQDEFIYLCCTVADYIRKNTNVPSSYHKNNGR